MWLVAGLGNPGDQYAYTWHNCGFLTAELLADKLDIEFNRSKFNGIYGKGRVAGEDVLVVKPQTFMNNSGECVGQMARYFKIEPSHVIIIYDDIDIAVGKIRVRPKGSAGTHNGMKSVIAHLGTQEFPRVRIGTGPVPEHMDLISYVLAQISKEQRPVLMDAFTQGADAVIDWIEKNG